jgi:hypothetical protein
MGKLWDLPTRVTKPIGGLINIKPLLIGVAAVGVSSMAAQAAYVYNNLGTVFNGGDCSFSTTCAAEAGRGDDFAAQLFSLGSATDITGGQWTELDVGPTSTAVNYAFYSDVGGLPGTLLFSGSSPDTATVLDDSSNPPFVQELISFGISSVSLPAGSYFFAIQSVSTNFETYLQEGAVNSGAAETMDGGATWISRYQGFGGVSVALTSTIPEPSTWAMMLLGFAGLGFAGYRQRHKVAGAASV